MSADAHAKPTPLVPGTLIAERYRLGEVLQVGGMGAVYTAMHEVLEQRVAVKVMLRDIASEPEAVARFLREARAAARLKSDHVVKVLDVGTHEGLPYMAMEFLEGHDLSEIAAKRGALPMGDAVGFVLQACEAIAEAHAAGIVHRDLKPSNLFLERRPGAEPRVKVLDFGISKTAPGAEVAARLTTTRAMLGSPAYMSPEQVRSTRDADERSDIWALGVILWELLTAEAAFDGDTIGEVFAKIREDPLPAVHERRAELPPALSLVVARAVERNRELRFQTVPELIAALEPFAPPLARNSTERTGPSADGSGRFVIVTEGRAHHAAETLPRPPSERPPPAATVVASPSETAARPDRATTLAAQTASTWSTSRGRTPRWRWWIGAGLALTGSAAVALVLATRGANTPSVASPPPSARAPTNASDGSPDHPSFETSVADRSSTASSADSAAPDSSGSAVSPPSSGSGSTSRPPPALPLAIPEPKPGVSAQPRPAPKKPKDFGF